MGRIDLSSYVDVAARIVEFRTKHPDGCLQPANLAEPFRVETIGEQTFIVVVAAAYRGPDDARPGIGMAYEPFPGQTRFTHFSELQNAETSAWGRAIVAALAADTRQGVASRDEVQNRQAEREQADQHSEWEPSRALWEQTRRNVIANATSSIEDAESVEVLNETAKRISAVVKRGLITAHDEVALRQKLMERRDQIDGLPDQETLV